MKGRTMQAADVAAALDEQTLKRWRSDAIYASPTRGLSGPATTSDALELSPAPDPLLRSRDVNFSYDELLALRANHPAWRLLCANRAALIISLLHRKFIADKRRAIDGPELTEALEDLLYELREQDAEARDGSTAEDWLEEWASPDKGWLRRFYKPGTDVIAYDLTPPAEKAIAWIGSLGERAFVGTESRLLTMTTLLRQMVQGTETDPAKRIAELQRQRDAIDEQMRAVVEGRAPVLDDVQLMDRWQHFEQLGVALQHDFREVEELLRSLDRRVRERIAGNLGPKGQLLDNILVERDAIKNSEQGRSFNAFFRLLMSARGRDEFTAMLERMLSHPSVREMKPDPRIVDMMNDCRTAASHTLDVARQLSEQLKRLIESGSLTESRRIALLLQSIEQHALAIRDLPVNEDELRMEIELPEADIELIMERPLYSPPKRIAIEDIPPPTEQPDVDMTLLFSQTEVDRDQLRSHVRAVMGDRAQVTLTDVLSEHPLEEGLAELVTYMQLGVSDFETVTDANNVDTITWASEDAHGNPVVRAARIHRLIFTRKA